MPRPQRKAAIDAKEKLAKTNELGTRETRDSPAKKEDAAEPATRANARGGAAGGAAAKAGIDKKQPAKTPVAKKEAALNPKKMEDNASEERSGDQPVVEDDATTAPVPDRVSKYRIARRVNSPPPDAPFTGTTTDAPLNLFFFLRFVFLKFLHVLSERVFFFFCNIPR